MYHKQIQSHEFSYCITRNVLNAITNVLKSEKFIPDMSELQLTAAAKNALLFFKVKGLSYVHVRSYIKCN